MKIKMDSIFFKPERLKKLTFSLLSKGTRPVEKYTRWRSKMRLATFEEHPKKSSPRSSGGCCLLTNGRHSQARFTYVSDRAVTGTVRREEQLHTCWKLLTLFPWWFLWRGVWGHTWLWPGLLLALHLGSTPEGAWGNHVGSLELNLVSHEQDSALQAAFSLQPLK